MPTNEGIMKSAIVLLLLTIVALIVLVAGTVAALYALNIKAALCVIVVVWATVALLAKKFIF